jgi:hypothetical protein
MNTGRDAVKKAQPFTTILFLGEAHDRVSDAELLARNIQILQH